MRRKQSLIMLVEDNPDHAELTKSCLEQQATVGRIVHMTDGSEAIDYLLTCGAAASPRECLPDLVLLDLRLPRVGGADVLRTIRGVVEVPRIPIIVLTSSEADRDVREAYACGANGYTVKPVDYDQLQKLITDICTFWLVWNRQPSVHTTVPEPTGPA